MAKALVGKYRAKVLSVAFEKMFADEVPVLNVNFQPIGQVVDNEVKPEEGLFKVNTLYYLDLNIQDKGKHAGKSGLEATRINLEETYGYKGAFDLVAMNEAMAGKEVDLVCEESKSGYTKVKYANAIGGKSGKKPIKALAENEIAAFAKEWSKGSVSATKAPATNAKDLFASLTGQADGK